MKLSRLSALCLASLWFAACATAQDGTAPGDSSGGSDGFSGSSSDTNGGTPGAPGASGSAGLPGTSGASSFAGAGGLSNGGASGSSTGGLANGGTAGSTAGGTSGGGTSGAGGSGGSAPVFDTGVCAVNPTMSLSYKQSNTGQQITGQYQFINTSSTPIPVASLKIRYFFTDEHTEGWMTSIYESQLDNPYLPLGTTTLTIVPLTTPLEGADSYTEIDFTSTGNIAMGSTGTVSWDMQPNGYNAPFQIQSNDYSFNAADTAFTVWDHIAIYQGSTLVWGCVPPSLNGGGSAGAGGDTGAAGETGAAGAQ